MSAYISANVQRTATEPAQRLIVGGLAALTTIDFPGHLAAVVFCQGCPWRCDYCHNQDLWPPRATAPIPWIEVLQFLERRHGLLDGVVFSGGEPTAQPALIDAVAQTRAMGFEVALHTAGVYPRRIETLLGEISWIGMDVKAPFDNYAAITGVDGSGARARESVQLIVEAGVNHEFRTTLTGALLEGDTLVRMAHALATLGVRHFVLQRQRTPGSTTPLPGVSEAIITRIQQLFDDFAVRG
jgi:pyruvate formate lyase activating enzyme